MNINRNRIITMLLSFAVLFSFSLFRIHAQRNDDSENAVIEEEFFSETDEEGNVHLYTAEDVLNADSEYIDFDIVRKIGDKEETVTKVGTFSEAKEVINRKRKTRSVGDYMIMESSNENKSRNSSPYKVVKFKAKYSGKNPMYTDITNVDTGHKTSVSWSTSRDAAYIGSEGDYHIIKISGIKAKVLKSDVDLVNYNNSLVISKYRTTQGKLYHYITKDMINESAVLLGKKPTYLADNSTYYSYDGHYFYTSYEKMIDDYVRGNYNQAVNSSTPFYNYYQYLSHRSKTGYTVSQLNTYLNHKVENDKTSKLYNMSDAFISAENTYGINAVLMLGVSINESGWGFSNLSQQKNNLFGHNAVDSDPFAQGSVYKTPADSVKSHAIVYATQYSDPADYRHFGSHLGDKQSGMNVYYATDAYWGEKAAQQAHYIDDYYKNDSESGKYKIGLTNATVNVRTEATTQSASVYKTANSKKSILNYPIVILEEVNGEAVSGNNQWYRIKSTSVLTDNRTGLKYDGTNASSDYKFSRDYVYIHKPNVTTIYNGRDLEGFKSGDVNKDNDINSKDLLAMEKHIVFGNNFKLSGAEFNRGDVDYDANINAKDLLSVEKHIIDRKVKVN